MRAERDLRLARSDWTQMPDSPLDEAARAAWAVYRQALRDITETPAGPAAVVWPSVPS
ncbi:MAG: phage tail assembly chaperone [Thermoleophilia bacterium]|nr:phage tail assembly chaperone [Thermoleophilia bacterium]